MRKALFGTRKFLRELLFIILPISKESVTDPFIFENISKGFSNPKETRT